jgi:endonuclease/exonuclease/phosphatase family metal-dependent hydrolase
VGALAFLLPAPALACPLEMSVITYNVFLRAPTWLFWNDHDARSAHMAEHLSAHDVIVLQEAFSNAHRDRITAALRATHPHRTRPLGADQWLSLNGGVYVFSRWPIEAERFHVFGECSGPDCLVKKGVVYARLGTPAGAVHMFALHLQAERAAGAVRTAQIGELRAFIDAQDIPADEPVLVAGDFNVDYYGADATPSAPFRALLDAVDGAFPEADPAPSFDADNTLLRGDVRERLDFVLHSGRHAQPCEAHSRVVRIRHEDRDLSDHHGVAARYAFPAPRGGAP